MRRLIEKGLMFGNLVPVNSPALVDRYNRALKKLIGKTTELADFHIDVSGYSPEVGDELGDMAYLNPRGVNRQFILLTPEQRRAPLLNAQFSMSRDILRSFIAENEAQLFALTATDAVAGELVNSVFHLSTPERLFDIRRIRIEADTTGRTLAHAQDLADKADRFRSEPGAWHDDVLIAEMIGLAGKTGDIIANPVHLSSREYPTESFWTAHFGGLYLFRGVEHPAALVSGDPEALGDLPIDKVIALSHPNRIAQFLDRNGLVEPIVRARGIDGAAILRQKMDFILIDAATDEGRDLTGLTRSDMRRLARSLEDIPPAWDGLRRLVAWAEEGAAWPKMTSEHPAYFHSLRAADTPYRDLVNMLLAELTPQDARQLFICHKEMFYRAYRRWPEAKKAFVAGFLESEYLIDKAGAREALFGHEPAMEEEPALPPRDDLVERVGPWGAVRRPG